MQASVDRSTRLALSHAVLLVVLVLLIVSACCPAVADLDSVTVGGEIRIRGNWWMNSFNGADRPLYVRYETRWPADAMVGRAIGSFLGGQNPASHFDWDSSSPDYRLVEQRTKLHVRANFTQDISAFVEFDSFDAWSEDFRSNYLTGIDARANTSEDVELYQGYLEANSLFGVPLRLRLGRQELVFGDGWLLGNNSALPEFTGLSYDAVRATYMHDLFTVDAFWAKLAERSPLEEDGDTDLYGLYASYIGIESVTIDAFWFWLRDAQAVNDGGDLIDQWIGHRLGLGEYDATSLHTIGLHSAGAVGAFDFTANVAYQFGDAASAGALFKPYTFGDNKAEYDSWAGDVDLGYSLDFTCKPRIHVGAAYFGGEDNRGVDFWNWARPWAPLVRPEASISFNRMFSNKVYSYFFDEMGELSNFWTVRAGVSARPTESIETGLDAAYYGVLETFDQPMNVKIGRGRLLPARGLSFLTQETSDDLGWELTLWLKYHYTADLVFEAGWSHLFAGDGLAEGNFNDMNGLLFNGGTADDDADYVYVQATLRF